MKIDLTVARCFSGSGRLHHIAMPWTDQEAIMLARTDLAESALKDSARQVAALVWRKAGPEPEVILVTSRISGHWLLPKGWPVEGKSASESAMQEAFEEAGVWGGCKDHPIGSYGYRKVLTGGAALQCTVDVFAVEAVGVLAHWPEREQRRREWVTLTEAAARVMEPGLAEFLRRCDERFVGEHFTPIPRSDAMSIPLAPITREKETIMISPAQCRAARALIDWSAGRLTDALPIGATTLGPVEGTSCKNTAWDPPPSEIKALEQLQIKAVEAGATGLTEVLYVKREFSMVTNCWATITASAMAYR